MNGGMIENPEAYEAAIQRNIRRNAATTRRRNWLAIEGNQELHDWLYQLGEFEGTSFEDADDIIHYNEHPLCLRMYEGSFGEFLFKMRESLEAWGGLTEKQTKVVSDALSRARGWADDRKQKAAERAVVEANSEYIGNVGDRQFFDLIVDKIINYESMFGGCFIHLCHEGENVVVYRGSKEFGEWTEDGQWESAEGKTITVKATIKEHSVHEGVKQTVINRPKVKEE